MKANLSRMWRNGIALLLAICMVVGFVPSVAFAATDDDVINYVSLGDSMTNGYCFTGYDQGNITPAQFLDGEKVYGEDAYPNLFEKYLKEQNPGKTVEHDKLAVSAMRAEDLNYLLGGREMPTDTWFEQVRHYSGIKDNDQMLKDIYQDAVEEAEVITMSIGNAAFGAYMVQYFTRMLGVMDGSLDKDEVVNLEEALVVLEPEQKEVVMTAYNKMLAMAKSYLPKDLDLGPLSDKMDQAIDMMAYIGAGFILNYEGVLDQMVKLNPDVEIVLIGLMNTTYGMTITGEGFDPIPFGDIVDIMFDALNAYVAGLPAVKQEMGEWTEAKFYYTDMANPEFIVQVFDDMAAAGWVDDGVGLSETIVRKRTIKAYNEALRPMLVPKLGDLAEVDLEDVQNYTISNNYSSGFDTLFVKWKGEATAAGTDVNAYIGTKLVSLAIYLALEEALAESVDTMEITLDGLLAMATDIMGALGDIPEELTQEPGPKTIKDALVTWFTGSDTALAMCKIFAMFKVGDGMSVHPTPAAHAKTAEAVKAAYGKHTAKDETLDNINWALGELQKIIAEYGPDMAQSVWQQWIDAGYVGAIDTLIDDLWTELQADHEYYKNAVPEINKAVQAMMTEQNRLVDELNALNKQLTDKKAELEDVIAKQEISDVTLPNIKIEVDLGNNTQTEVYEHECVVKGEGIEAELKAAIADLEHAIAVVEALIADITADIEDMVALAEQIAAAAAEFEKTFADIQKAAKDLENAFNAIKDVLAKDADKTEAQISAAYTAARKTALAAISVLDTAMGVASDMSADIEELLGMIEDAAEALQGEVMGDLEAALNIKYLSDTEKSILYVTAMVALPLLEEYKDDLKAELTNLVNAKKDEYTDLIRDEKDKWLLHIQEKNGELLLKKDEMVKYIKDEYAIQEQKIRDEYENVIKPERLQKRDELTLDLQAKQDQMEQYLKDLAEATDDAVKAEIQAAIDLLQPQIDRVSKDLATVNADLECMTEHLDAALAEAYDKVSAEAEKLYGEAIDALDKAIVELNDAMNKAVQELTDAMNKAVKELEDAFNKQIAALDAAIKAQIAALELEQKKAEFLKKIADAEQAVKDLLAKIDNEIKSKVAEAEDKIRDEYNAAMAELLKQKAALEAELKAAQKALADAADAAKAEIEKQIDKIEDEIARVEKEIADAAAKLEADLKEAHDKIVKEVNDAYAQTLAELEKAVDDLKKAMAKEIAELEKELDELIASLDGEVKDLLAELKNKVADSFNDILDNFKFDLDLGVNLDGINDALNALKDALVDAGIDSLESLGNILSKLFQDMLYAATHADLTIDNDFKYLALGDGSAASKSYAEDLAEMLQAEATENGIKKPITFVNHAEVGKTVAEEAADLCDEVASADLITLGYSQTEMMAKALKVIDEDQDVDWVGLVGKEAAVYIEEALEKVFAELDAVELPEMIAPYIKAIVEAYAYGAVEYAVKMPALLLAIREVNKDAVVINVGMYNPLADVVIDGMDMSQFNEYFNYLIDGVAVYGIGLAMLTNQIDYVDARDVAVAQPELKFTTLIAQLMGNDGLKALYPSEEGDDYIANQIAKALNLSFTGLLGDVNDDGKVLANDAMLVLQYSVGQIKADKLNLSVADVTGDGKILANDAMEILQYSVGARTRFSCEK